MTIRFTLLVVAWLGLAATATSPVLRAQAPAAGRTPADTLYADAVAKEAAVLNALSARTSNRTILKAVRTVITDFESIVRQYPTSGYCDDALWRGARIGADAFARFGEGRDQAAAVRLLQALISQYPTSRLARQAPARLAALSAQPAPKADSAAPPPAAAPPAVRPLAGPPTDGRAVREPSSPAPVRDHLTATTTPPEPPATVPLATIKAIRRSVLPDSVRVIIELDAEVPFHDERLSNPARVFVDLMSTKANRTLIDQTIRFESDADVVRQIRVGRHPNQTTRIVLDADGVTSYSVYPLYSPYRLVIDCLRAAPAPAVSRSAEAVKQPPTSPAPAAGAAPEPRPSSLPAWARPPKAPAPAAAGTEPPPSPSRPAWARPPNPPPVLTSRRLADWSLLPPARTPLTSFELPELAGPTAAAAGPAVTPSLPATRASGQAEAAPTPATAVSPSHNLKGGFSIARQLGLGVSRIVIDPGHGGHDSGANGGGQSEADLVLDIALRLEKLLAKVSGVEVVLTRRGDQYVSLQERTAIANRESADLFLSIHANASTTPQARGVETYFLNFATNLSAASVAARENAASGQAMATLPDVVKTIALNNKLDESREFATHVQRAVVEKLKPSNAAVRDLGVKQAPFVVLVGAAMPSVLAEISFLTNPQEAKLLKGSAYRQKIAEALFDAIRKYQAALRSAPKIAEQNQ